MIESKETIIIVKKITISERFVNISLNKQAFGDKTVKEKIIRP